MSQEEKPKPVLQVLQGGQASQPSPSNKYLTRLEEAIEEDAHALIKIFNHVKEVVAALEAADISPEAKFDAGKRLQKFVQDVYSAIPNTYRPFVQDMVQQAMFPDVAEKSPVLQDPLPQEAPVSADTTPETEPEPPTPGAA